MKRVTQYGLLLASIGCSAVIARADAIGDYRVILERNPFGLKPPVAPVPIPTAAPSETPTNYKLSGITALFNPPRAMFVNLGVPGKPEYLSLSEGQRQGSLEVLAGGINFKAGVVLVKISGEERTLSFEKDGIKPAMGPPGVTVPGVPVPRSSFNPASPTLSSPIVPSANAAPAIQNLQSGSMPIPAPGVTAYPSRTPRSGGAVAIPLGNTGNQTSPPPAPDVDPVVQTVAIEVQRAATRKAVAAGQLPPLPPTDLSPPPPPAP